MSRSCIPAVTTSSFISTLYYAGLALCFPFSQKACNALHMSLGNGFVTSEFLPFRVTSDFSAFQGLMPYEGHEGETVTRGLEHLEANCQQYYRYSCSHHSVMVVLPWIEVYIALCILSCKATRICSVKSRQISVLSSLVEAIFVVCAEHVHTVHLANGMTNLQMA